MCFTSTILNALVAFCTVERLKQGFWEIGLTVSWVFSQKHFKSHVCAQFLDFAACFGHMVLLFSFSCEGQKNLSRARAEGRGADSALGLRDDVVVRMYGKYCQAAGGTGIFWASTALFACSCTGLNAHIKAGFLKLW